MHSGDTQIQRTEKFLNISSAPVFMGDLVSVETKEGLAFTFSSLLPTFLLFPKGRDNPV